MRKNILARNNRSAGRLELLAVNGAGENYPLLRAQHCAQAPIESAKRCSIGSNHTSMAHAVLIFTLGRECLVLKQYHAARRMQRYSITTA
jgi:hypothetical protein